MPLKIFFSILLSFCFIQADTSKSIFNTIIHSFFPVAKSYCIGTDTIMLENLYFQYNKRGSIQKGNLVLESTKKYENIYFKIVSGNTMSLRTYPDFFSSNKQWKLDPISHIYSLQESNNDKLFSLSDNVLAIDLYFRGDPQEQFIGILEVWNDNQILNTIPIIIKPYIWWEYYRSYYQQYLSIFFLFVILLLCMYCGRLFVRWIQLLLLKKKIQLFQFPLHGLQYSMESPFTLNISRYKNPFYCELPFLKRPLFISVDNGIVTIRTGRGRRNKYKTDLNETQGVFTFQLYNNINISFCEKKFVTDKGIVRFVEMEILDIKHNNE